MQSNGPSRRAVLRGTLSSRASPAEPSAIHISSAIVTVLPDRREAILDRLALLPGVEIHHAELFKIVVVMEAVDAGTIGGRLAEIATWSGVLSANMVFEQTEQLSHTGEPT